MNCRENPVKHYSVWKHHSYPTLRQLTNCHTASADSTNVFSNETWKIF